MKQKEILILLVPALIVIVFLVIFNIYHNYATSSVTDPLITEINPIEGRFDTETIEQLKTRVRVEGALKAQINPSISPSPSTAPALEEEEEASPSSQISPTITPGVNL